MAKSSILNTIDVFDFANVMLIVLDTDGKVIEINKKGCEILEYKKHEIIGRDWFHDFLLKDERKKVKDAFLSIIRGKSEKFRDFENKILCKSGKQKIILWHNTFLKDSKGKILGAVSSGQDVTKYRNVEKELMEKINAIRKTKDYMELRAKIWQIAADRTLSFNEIIDKSIKLIGPVLKVSRVNYNEINEKESICRKEWKEKNVKGTVGSRMDMKIVRTFLKPDGFEITYDKALKMMPPALKVFAKPVIKKFSEVNDLKGIFVIPIYVDNKIYSSVSYDICNSNKNKDGFDEFDKSILIELRNILQNRIEYDRIKNATNESEEKFKMLFENSPDAYYINDLKGNFINANKKAEEITGYRKEELIGKNFFKIKLLSKIHAPKAMELLIQNLKNKSTGPDEITLIKKDGTPINVEIMTRPITFKGQKMVLGIARDVTERNRYLQEIKRLQVAVEQSPDSIIITDVNGKIVYVNPIFTKLTGYSSYEVTGKTPRILKSGHTSREEYKKLWDTILSGRIWRGEFLNKKKDGGTYWESASIAPIKDKNGKITNFIAIKQDITEAKKIRDEIAENRMMLQDFFDNANDLIQILSPDAKFIYVNKAWKNILGYSYNEIKNLTVFDIIHPSRIEHCKELFQKILQGKCEDKIETIFVTKDKKEIIVEGNVSCHIENGKPINTRGIFRDITAKKKEEENLKTSYEKLKELDAMKTNFVSMISHDLRTPITAIKGFLSLMLGGATGEITSQQKEYLEIIQNNSERLLNLINDLLDISRIETGKFTIEKNTSDMGRIMDNLVKELSHYVARKKIVIVNESAGKKLQCNVDEYRISQVLTNLITNSFKFSPENTKIILGFKEVNKDEIKVPENIKIPGYNKFIF
ncbi:MAG TPA: PAS domain S-box protein, partial [Candidatus Goldiibacteriota bacterium]|nr:PAS domain S-box protein [Candidatus Goldiibacteriota bacterium]